MNQDSDYKEILKYRLGNYFTFIEFDISEIDHKIIMSELSLKIFPFIMKTTFFGSNYLFRFYFFSLYMGITLGYDETE